MQFIDKPVRIKDIWSKRTTKFSAMIKIAVDIDKEWIVLDGELHSDCEAAVSYTHLTLPTILRV